MLRLLIASAFLTCVIPATAQAAPAPLGIVVDGKPQAVIVLQPDASEQLAEAAGELQQLVLKATGATLAMAGGPDPERIAIHIGRTAVVKALNIDLGELDGDGFVIRIPDERTVLILGPTDWGTEFGIYEFLERYVGVRWLMPGPDGTYVPRKTTITVPRVDVRDQPAFFSRKFFGLRLPEQRLWARRNRLHSRVEFHHQLYRLFPPSDVAEHPEFFPIQKGVRYLPDPTVHFKRWQPCFTAPGIVKTAIARIVKHFDEHPDAESYSFGVTDSGGHCECAKCRALDPGRKNMVGKDHLSDRYFTWVNAVIEGVLKKHPDKWFGCLAYSEIYEPPDRVKVHPRMIPYMTYDRMQWANPESRKANEEVTQRWGKASPVTGWYDYIYGAAYLVPRVYPHLMGEYYRFAHRNGVRGLTAEAYPNFGEGPKLYVSLRLQWDPERDVDQLLDEWYTLAVGAEAAPHIRKYYAHWETFWTRTTLQSKWWPKGRQYLPFNVPTYLADVPVGDMATCRGWLEKAVALASGEQRVRAQLLLRAFEYYEASVTAYPRENAVPTLTTEADAVAWLGHLRNRVASAEKRRVLSKQTFHNHPFLHHCMSIDRYASLAGTDWAGQDVWSLFGWINRSESLRKRLATLAAPGNPEGLRAHVATILACVDREEAPLNANPSFEQGEGSSSPGWDRWLQEQVGTLARSEEAARMGRAGMLATGVQYGGPHQSIDFAAGRYCLVASLFVPPEQAKGGFVDLSMRALNEASHNLPGGSTTSITPTPGVWHIAATVMDVRSPPTGAVRIRAGVWVRKFPKGKRIYIDDVRLFRLRED
jgi:hypothetical protein